MKKIYSLIYTANIDNNPRRMIDNCATIFVALKQYRKMLEENVAKDIIVIETYETEVGFLNSRIIEDGLPF